MLLQFLSSAACPSRRCTKSPASGVDLRLQLVRAIQSVRQRNLEPNEWLENLARGLKWQLSELRELGEGLIRLDLLTTTHNLSARQRIAPQLALAHADFQIQDLETKCPGVHRRTLQRDLRGLIEKGVLIGEGATNQLVHRVSPNA